MRATPIWPALFLAAFAQEPPKPEIGWALKEGEPVRYELEKRTLLHGKMGTVEMSMKLGLVLEPGKRDGEGKTPLKITIDRVGMSGKDDKEEEVYDSDRDKADPKHPTIRIMAGCLNGTFEAKLSREGSISDIRGLKEILEKSTQNVPELKAMGDDKAASRFAGSLDQLLQEGFSLAAGKALAKGDSWESGLAGVVFGNGEAPVKIKSTVKEIGPGETVIGRELNLDFSKDPRNPDGKGAGTGDVTWSTERGLALSGQWKLHVTTSSVTSDTTFSIKLAPRGKK